MYFCDKPIDIDLFGIERIDRFRRELMQRINAGEPFAGIDLEQMVGLNKSTLDFFHVSVATRAKINALRQQKEALPMAA